jgi:hypothetical protein
MGCLKNIDALRIWVRFIRNIFTEPGKGGKGAVFHILYEKVVWEILTVSFSDSVGRYKVICVDLS